jgi:hypothetical protein
MRDRCRCGRVTFELARAVRQIARHLWREAMTVRTVFESRGFHRQAGGYLGAVRANGGIARFDTGGVA